MEVRFDGKVVAIAGGAWGIGRGIAQKFAQLGATVHVSDIRREELDVTQNLGTHVSVVDLTDSKAVNAWVDGIASQSGTIDIAINNAGGIANYMPHPIEEVSDEEWELIMSINSRTTFNVCRAVIPLMKKANAGRIVNISSGAGLRTGNAHIHAYTAAKHAVVGLTRQLAQEVGPYGITINSVAPGSVNSTANTDKFWAARSDESKQALLQKIFMRRRGEIDDIVYPVLFLCSDYASWITGQVLAVDGGK